MEARSEEGTAIKDDSSEATPKGTDVEMLERWEGHGLPMSFLTEQLC